MNQLKLVSIIIPVYNGRKYIKEAVDSALRQTHKRKEVIVVDDGSTDGLSDLMKQYIDNKLIKYVYQENRGLSAARNAGVKNAKGELVAFLDADDAFLPHKIEEQARIFDDSEIGVCYSAPLHFTEEPMKFFVHK